MIENIKLIDRFEQLLFSRGYADSDVRSLKEFLNLNGYADEVMCISYNFDNMMFNGELENF